MSLFTRPHVGDNAWRPVVKRGRTVAWEMVEIVDRDDSSYTVIRPDGSEIRGVLPGALSWQPRGDQPRVTRG